MPQIPESEPHVRAGGQQELVGVTATQVHAVDGVVCRLETQRGIGGGLGHRYMDEWMHSHKTGTHTHTHTHTHRRHDEL